MWTLSKRAAVVLTRLAPAILLVGLLTALFGCDESQTRAEPFSVRDSAGVRIVESHAPLWRGGESWRLSEMPELEIGVAEGELPYLFSRIAGAVRLEDGRIVVADGQSNQIRFFDSSGRFLQSVGGEGKGPGEYEYIRDLGRCGGDSIFGFDLHWQAKVYTPSGQLVREMALHEPGSMRTPYRLDCTRAGRFVVVGWGEQAMRRVVGFYRSTAPAWVLDERGAEILSLGEFLSSERLGSSTGSSRPHPFGRSATMTIGPDRIYLGTGEPFEIEVRAMDGRLAQLVRGPGYDLEIRQEHLERYREERLAAVPDERRPIVERELRDMPLPDGFPAYDRLVLDPERNLWARRFLRPGDERRSWVVFSADGVLLGAVEVPADLEITEIGEDYVLGTARDELDVERVRLYRLYKASAG